MVISIFQNSIFIQLLINLQGLTGLSFRFYPSFHLLFVFGIHTYLMNTVRCCCCCCCYSSWIFGQMSVFVRSKNNHQERINNKTIRILFYFFNVSVAALATNSLPQYTCHMKSMFITFHGNTYTTHEMLYNDFGSFRRFIMYFFFWHKH